MVGRSSKAADSRLEKAPQQARSRRTQQRLLDATERLLRSTDFEAITIAAIVREARSSVGSFYARFPDKQALLLALYERHDAQLEEFELAAADSLSELAVRTCRDLVRSHRERRGFLRAICLYARASPDTIADEVRARRARFHRRLALPFAAFAGEMPHADPVQAAEWALFVVAAVVRDKILFSEAPHAASLAMDDDAVAEELSRTMLAYLRSASPPGG